MAEMATAIASMSRNSSRRWPASSDEPRHSETAPAVAAIPGGNTRRRWNDMTELVKNHLETFLDLSVMLKVEEFFL